MNALRERREIELPSTYSPDVLRRTALSFVLTLCACEGQSSSDPMVLGHRAAVAGDHVAASEHYGDATESRPDDIEAWTGLARSELRAGDSVAAANAARPGLLSLPDGPHPARGTTGRRDDTFARAALRDLEPTS